MEEKPAEKLFPKSRVTRMVKRALEIGEHKAIDRYNIPLLRLNAGGIIEKVNKKATTSFSTPAEQLIGRPVTELFHSEPGDHHTILHEVNAAMSKAEPGQTVALPPALVMRKDPSGESIESIARFSVYRPVKGEPKIYVSMTHTRRVLEKSKLLREFFDLADTVNSQRDLNKVLQGVADHFASRFNAIAIVVRPNGGNTLKLAAAAGKGLNVPDFIRFNEIPIGSGLLGKAAESLRPIEVENLREWSESFNPELDADYNFHHSIAVPLTVKGADGKPVLVGVIGLFKGGEHAHEKFRPHEKRMFEVLAGNTATAIHNAKLTRDLRFMAERDEQTGLYNRRVLFRRMR
ncbi:GAF domain-containing protein, partial [Candidatus Micrarchaeota archaeon]|nr:GAF domain-containing protein [Candidatus Micrarchaeota archaeon]